MIFACPSRYLKDIPADVLAGHRDWLKRLTESGQLLSAGRLADGSGGLVLLQAADEAEARAMLAADPFSTAGISDYQLFGYTPSFGALGR